MQRFVAVFVALLSVASAFMPAGSRSRAGTVQLSMEGSMEMSKSVPFVKKPANLEGMIVSFLLLLLIFMMMIQETSSGPSISLTYCSSSNS